MKSESPRRGKIIGALELIFFVSILQARARARTNELYAIKMYKTK